MTKKRRKNKGLKMNRKTFSEISKTQIFSPQKKQKKIFKKVKLKKTNDQENKTF